MSDTEARSDAAPKAGAHGGVSHRTLYLAVFAAFLCGFVGGIGYSAFRTPAHTSHEHHHHPAGAAAAGEAATPDRTNLSVEELEKRAQADPDNARVWTDLAHAFHDSGMFEDAIAAYNRSLAVEPDDADVRTDMGVVYYQSDNPALALVTFEQVLHEQPKHAKARFNKGVVLYQGLGRKEKALEQWRILLEQEPEMRTPEGITLKELVDRLEEESKEEPAAATPEPAENKP